MKQIKIFFLNLVQCVKGWWRGFRRLTTFDGNPMSDEQPPYPNCRNCGTELIGVYCHKCGQRASLSNLKMWKFIGEYLENVFLLDSKLPPTLSNLIFHPGRLPKEYFSERIVSYINPLKLNLFILLVMLMIMALIGTDIKIKGAFAEATDKELFISESVLSTIATSDEYMQKIASSQRDTLRLVASHIIVEKYEQVVDIVDLISVTDVEEPDTMIVAVPTAMLDDNLIVELEDGFYFSCDNDIMNDELMMAEMAEAWSELTTLFFKHFPILMLLTAPFLAFSVRRIVKRKEFPKSYSYIFSFYYMAFVELLALTLFLIGVTFDVSYSSMRIYIHIILFLYLTIALKNTYAIKSWIGSAAAAMLINVIYMFSCIVVISMLSLIVITTQLM